MNVFDIIGPVMIGPSSSHTAGAARIGRFAHNLLGEMPESAEILFHGSFAKTYRGHGSDKAIIGGAMGMETDDIRIRTSMELAEQVGMHYSITTGEILNAHPNAAKITLSGKNGKQVAVVGESVGGGNIRITQINGLSVDITGGYDTLVVVHKDTPGVVAAVTKCLGEEQVNVHNLHLSREERGGTAILTIEVDGKLSTNINEKVSCLEHIYSSSLIPQL